ncbi:hypothetical protein [Ralstonia phage RP31]|uniref:Uncharacterized protein n=2 Tax=Ripduovirus RP12 TaxID=2560700 RepID=A0A1L7N1U5_9CAUD|nr:hypothetical protein FDH28_gp151 [Ralstonia phage RP12]BAW19244.1 hypothetical protein [Ralstonia phage RP12]BAW19530.1 hypothetical protein [Ralstonia phage RP31]
MAASKTNSTKATDAKTADRASVPVKKPAPRKPVSAKPAVPANTAVGDALKTAANKPNSNVDQNLKDAVNGVKKPAAKKPSNAPAGAKPAAKKAPVRKPSKAALKADLTKRANDLIAEAKEAGWALAIVLEAGKPVVKLYETKAK